MPGDNSGAEPPEWERCRNCDGTGLDPESGEQCERCEGFGEVEPDPGDWDEPWPTGASI